MEYLEMIISSSSKNRFTVHLIDGSHIQDFKTWWPKVYRKNSISQETSSRSIPRSQKESYNISKYHFYKFCRDNGKGVVMTRVYIGGLETNTFSLLLPAITSVELPLQPAYPLEKIPISAKKMKHVQKCAKFVSEDPGVQEFWQEIVEWEVNEGRIEDGEDVE